MHLLPEILQEILKCSKNLQKYIQSILKENKRLTRENKELIARINQNSTNSSKPPSTCPFIKPKSLKG